MKKRIKFFTKKQADRLLWRIYDRIKKEECVVKLDRSIAPDHAHLYIGKKPSETTITINPDKQIISCFVHEYLHLFYNDDFAPYSYLTKKEYEDMILDMEWELINEHWSMIQLERLLKRLTHLIGKKI